MTRRVGVLGLQGDFALHQKSLERLGVEAPAIRWPEELDGIGGLIIPGGESTTFVKLLKETGLFEAVTEFAKKRPVMGTCAGLITCATKLSNDTIETLGLIDIEAERNSYGRQVDSFIAAVQIPLFKDKPGFEGVFIRAPRILKLGKDVEPLGFNGEEVVLARNARVLVAAFHPELTRDLRIHRYFIETFVRQ